MAKNDLMTSLAQGYMEEGQAPGMAPEGMRQRGAPAPVSAPAPMPMKPGAMSSQLRTLLQEYGKAIVELDTRLKAIEQVIGSVVGGETETPDMTEGEVSPADTGTTQGG